MARFAIDKLELLSILRTPKEMALPRWRKEIRHA
jgi:hypothetical protein